MPQFTHGNRRHDDRSAVRQRTTLTGEPPSTAHPVLRLQRTAGNAAVAHLAHVGPNLPAAPAVLQRQWEGDSKGLGGADFQQDGEDVVIDLGAHGIDPAEVEDYEVYAGSERLDVLGKAFHGDKVTLYVPAARAKDVTSVWLSRNGGADTSQQSGDETGAELGTGAGEGTGVTGGTISGADGSETSGDTASGTTDAGDSRGESAGSGVLEELTDLDKIKADGFDHLMTEIEKALNDKKITAMGPTIRTIRQHFANADDDAKMKIYRIMFPTHSKIVNGDKKAASKAVTAALERIRAL